MTIYIYFFFSNLGLHLPLKKYDFFCRENISKNHVWHEEFLSASSAMDEKCDSRTSDMLAAVDGNFNSSFFTFHSVLHKIQSL